MPWLRSNPARSKEGGWALLTILLACAIFMIMLANVVPDAAFEARRGREQDLMFRGKDYMRAIGLYYRKFKKYPTRLEDLENTNQIRFLRRRWPDPMTKSDEWRLLHVNGAGLVVDSVLATTGSTTQPGQAGQQQPNIGLTPSASSTSSSTSSPASPSTGTATSIGTSIASTTGSTTSGFSGQPTVVGAFLAGVASKSEKPSIMTYNTRQKYNEWEFVYDPRKDPMMAQQGLAGQPARTGPVAGPGGTSPGGPGGLTPPNPPGSGTIGVPVVTPTRP
jgi:type II secretory pathway pseudopilin PulG